MEKSIIASDQVQENEEDFRNSYWIKDKRLIFFTNERTIIFDDNLNEIATSMVAGFSTKIYFVETAIKGY